MSFETREVDEAICLRDVASFFKRTGDRAVLTLLDSSEKVLDLDVSDPGDAPGLYRMNFHVYDAKRELLYFEITGYHYAGLAVFDRKTGSGVGMNDTPAFSGIEMLAVSMGAPDGGLATLHDFEIFDFSTRPLRKVFTCTTSYYGQAHVSAKEPLCYSSEISGWLTNPSWRGSDVITFDYTRVSDNTVIRDYAEARLVAGAWRVEILKKEAP